MSELINTWGQVMLYAGDFHLIHPTEYESRTEDELDKLFDNRIFYCSENIDGYLVLKDLTGSYRVKPDKYVVRSRPTYFYGDFVEDMQNPQRKGIIRFIGWHYKREKLYYHLYIGERKSTKRYFADDLRLIKKGNFETQ